MEFWGVEVKSGQPVSVVNELNMLLHLSHATLGESKANKGNESVPLFVKVNDQKLVLGTLFTEKAPQLNFDLVFKRGFELSHNWKNGSVFFMGYKSVVAEDDELGSEFESDSDDDIQMHLGNGKLEMRVVEPSTAKADAKLQSSEKSKVKAEGSQKDKFKIGIEDDEEDESSSDSDDDEEMGEGAEDSSDEDGEEESSDEDGGEDSSDEDGEEDSSEDDEDEDTPEKAEPSNKRLSGSATKTPVPAKKAKFSSPQKTDGKKGVHTATPHPSKQVKKTPADNKKLDSNKNAQTPKSGSQVSCSSCAKTFNSEAGLQRHTKAKHSGE